MAKMGRPKKATKDRQRVQIAIRVTDGEHVKLKRAAKKSKLTISDYVRDELGLRGDKRTECNC